MANIFFKFDIIFKLFAPDLLKRQEKAGKILHNFTEKIIEQRRQSLLEQNENIHMKEAEGDFDTLHHPLVIISKNPFQMTSV